MSALTTERNTVAIAAGGMQFTRCLEVASGSVVYAGAMVAVNSGGKAVPATSSGVYTVDGRAENTASGGQTVKTRSGVFLYNNNTTSSAGITDIGKSFLNYLDDNPDKANVFLNELEKIRKTDEESLF